ncbi:hypothetical protein P5G51_000635 [Virgibacillus sp. 179-BFC.A HS]|uniref:Uncharacterized protein n=1 Tax=Tigheibacillus jepli TaxID=3035914 RepID=A0ABU5CE71_9BACI|nr:hypothetical protein [Virgibacillus sp. 179-BFC.A HS]MDY0404114.1 hypothetical protein [Virgibacillus sp. 179-BFC.A HS]
MRRYVVIALCVAVFAGVIFAVLHKNREETDASHFALTPSRKRLLKMQKSQAGICLIRRLTRLPLVKENNCLTNI